MDRLWILLLPLVMFLVACQDNSSQAEKEKIAPVVKLSKVPGDFFQAPKELKPQEGSIAGS